MMMTAGTMTTIAVMMTIGERAMSAGAVTTTMTMTAGKKTVTGGMTGPGRHDGRTPTHGKADPNATATTGAKNTATEAIETESDAENANAKVTDTMTPKRAKDGAESDAENANAKVTGTGTARSARDGAESDAENANAKVTGTGTARNARGGAKSDVENANATDRGKAMGDGRNTQTENASRSSSDAMTQTGTDG